MVARLARFRLGIAAKASAKPGSAGNSSAVGTLDMPPANTSAKLGRPVDELGRLGMPANWGMGK
ncbi:hypothetical protein NIIDMKKI_14990 [Mycobacterium kansasii]|uniref:Uncharacterized protein n=1 Tax=Mycobacterium kansasii TaxID=1768 RepID=A0A7G1I7L6_MYCKA|nr:hypothetical protein NIIDMKKI_14990 [Mycobacterium kansasii]